MVTNVEHLSKQSNYSTQKTHIESIGSSLKGSYGLRMCILLAMYVYQYF